LSARHLAIVAGIASALCLGGCTYDYLQRTDRVGYSAGEAVRANIERETTDPHRRSVRSVQGLGKDGQVVGPVGTAVPSLTP
jgi:DNA-binding transcriptional regulator LsrR (DeoR family)